MYFLANYSICLPCIIFFSALFYKYCIKEKDKNGVAINDTLNLLKIRAELVIPKTTLKGTKYLLA